MAKATDITRNADFRRGYRMGYSNQLGVPQAGIAQPIRLRSADNPLFYRGLKLGETDARIGVTDAMYRKFAA